MTQAAVLVGVDIVSADRLALAERRGGEVFRHHLTGPGEWPAGPAFCVKESLIKAIGGRPPGFTWHDFRALGEAPPPWAAELLARAAAELLEGIGIAVRGTAAYHLGGASGNAAAERLSAPAAAAALWGEGDGLVAALAIVFTDQSTGGKDPDVT